MVSLIIGLRRAARNDETYPKDWRRRIRDTEGVEFIADSEYGMLVKAPEEVRQYLKQEHGSYAHVEIIAGMSIPPGGEPKVEVSQMQKLKIRDGAGVGSRAEVLSSLASDNLRLRFHGAGPDGNGDLLVQVQTVKHVTDRIMEVSGVLEDGSRVYCTLRFAGPAGPGVAQT